MSLKIFLRQFYYRNCKNLFSHLRVICNHKCHFCISKNLMKSVKHATTKEEKTFKSRSKQTGYAYITDASCAESIALHISNDWKDGYIFEANPGLGVLTKAILNTPVPHLRIFEKHSEFLPELQALKSDHPNLEIVEENFLSLPYLVTKSLHSGNNELESIFSGVQELLWKEGVPLRVFATICSKKSVKFLRFLLIALADRSSIFSYGRCEFIVLVIESEYKYMQAEAKGSYSTYRWATVLYNLFFEIKFLEKFPSHVLFPKIKTENENQSFYLMKLTPKPNLYSSLVNENKLVEFYFFIRHLLAKRSSLVIPTLECWIPSCGPRLIKEGMHVFTKFGDLNPNQLAHLFNQFSSWPEYPNSTFHFAMQEFFKKKSLNPSLDEHDNI